jgi:hypothetical protein
MILYNLRRCAHGYMIAKFSEDFNVEGVYELVPIGPVPTATKANPNPIAPHSCSCPAGPRPTCRHRHMLPIMVPKVDTDNFYCYEKNIWARPLAVHRDAVEETKVPPKAAYGAPPQEEVERIVRVEEPPTTIEQDQVTGHTSQVDEQADIACAPNRVEPTAPTFKRRI